MVCKTWGITCEQQKHVHYSISIIDAIHPLIKKMLIFLFAIELALGTMDSRILKSGISLNINGIRQTV